VDFGFIERVVDFNALGYGLLLLSMVFSLASAGAYFNGFLKAIAARKEGILNERLPGEPTIPSERPPAASARSREAGRLRAPARHRPRVGRAELRRPIDTKPAYLVSECLDCGEAAQSRCRDALDNDEDGLSDCDDPDCAGAYACLARGPESTAERCADGLDNDENGFTDCGDFGCRSTSACRTPVKIDENTPATCADGLDDDWDGRIDCEDSDCALAETVTSCEGSNARCSDGVDNDGNGFTDCSDFSCSRGDSVTVCQ
jgi:hypothetical protein